MEKKYQPIRDYKVVTSSSPSELAKMVKKLMEEGFVPQGGMQVVEIHRQNRYAGTQWMDTVIQNEYTQAMYKETQIGDLSDEEMQKHFEKFATRKLGDISDKELFGKELKEDVLYKIRFMFNNNLRVAVARYVSNTNTLYYLSLEGYPNCGVGYENPSKFTQLEILDIIE